MQHWPSLYRVSCFASHCAGACRACVSETLENMTCGCANVLRCTRKSAQDVVQCVVNRLLSCPVVCGFVSGALRWVTLGRTQRLPLQRSVSQRITAPGTLADLLGARAGEIPDCSVRPSLSVFLGSRRQWVVNPRTRVFCLSESPNGDSTSEQVVKGVPLLSLRTGDSTSEQVVRGNLHPTGNRLGCSATKW